MTTIVFGLYDELSDARHVVHDLVDAGIVRDDISLVVRDRDGHYATYLQGQQSEATEDALEEEEEGAVAGGVFGGLAGLLLGLGVFAIPGVGAVVAAGPLAAMLVGAGAGTVTGGLIGSIVKWDVPEKEAESYIEAVHQGRTLVSVTTSNDRADRVMAIMNRYRPVNEIKSYTTAETVSEPSEA